MSGDFLVPLLRTDGGCPDPIAIETWHVALGSAIAVELPHDLFALWLFPRGGGAVLLGPEALGADQVPVPRPAPALQQADLYRLEETLRQAKYPSAIAAPIREQGHDVGVILLGSFSRAAFGPVQAKALQRLAARLAPTMAELAERMPGVGPRPLMVPGITRDNMPEHLARAACEAVNGADLVSRTSGILYSLLPHDQLEILLPGSLPEAYVGLSGNSPRRRWSGRGNPETESLEAILSRFGESASLLIANLAELEPPMVWQVAGQPLPARSLIGVRLVVAGRQVGCLLLGSVGADAYRPEDEDTLAVAGLLLAPRVAGLRPSGESPPHRTAGGPSEPGESPIRRAAAALAETARLEEGLRNFAAELARLLPHQQLRVHLRRGESEVIALDPRAPRPFADLPGIPVRAFDGAELLQEDRQWLALTGPGGDEVLVPLTVAGRAVGTLGVRNAGVPSAREAAAILRPFADVLAPHLELLRRGARATRITIDAPTHPG